MRTTVEVFTPEQRAELLQDLEVILYEDEDDQLRELRCRAHFGRFVHSAVLNTTFVVSKLVRRSGRVWV
ncbi:hypothetical protein OV079_51380 [Nannocystis pusilla]|uniref:Uncharacterized protein n=1 Tax=Nannocystis pusilla TaxID=889268 RepID=A0A9X3J401_9BACT|nr:hypothetical protein [Nannocystis pusilla]MCY1013795.1 hypothetical protein [Nannocystis pusilla]